MTFQPTSNKLLPLLVIWTVEILVDVSGFSRRDMEGTYKLDMRTRGNDTTGLRNWLKKLGYSNEFIKAFFGSKFIHFYVNVEGSEEVNPNDVEIFTDPAIVLPVAAHSHSSKYKVGKTVESTFYDGTKCNGTLYITSWEEIKISQVVDGKFECDITYSFSSMLCKVYYIWTDLKTGKTWESIIHFDKIKEHGKFSHRLRYH